jgi:hypothetical protein
MIESLTQHWTSNVVVTNGHSNCHPPDSRGHFTMATKYAFGQGLKELRFLFCQTSEHSAATRYATHHPQELVLQCAQRQRDGACLGESGD